MRLDIQEIAKPSALLFDMDGVLIDSEPLHVRAKRDALRAVGIEVSEEQFASYTGRSDKIMIDDLAAAHALTEAQAESILKHKHRIYQELEHELLPVQGAVEFVRWAHRNFRLAVATSANQRNRIAHTEHLGISPLFETAVDSARFRHPKPSPEVFQIAMQDLGLDPAECWVIEDATMGILAAKAAGCTAVGLTTSFSAEALFEAGADMVVSSFVELRATLDAISAPQRTGRDAGVPAEWLQVSFDGLTCEGLPVAECTTQSSLHPPVA